MFSIKKNLVKKFIQNISIFIRKRSHQFNNKDLLTKISRVIYLTSLRIMYAKNEDFRKDTKNVNFFVIAWGNYNDLFIKYSLPSLLQEKNLKWIKENYQFEIDFYTDKDYAWFVKNYPKMAIVFKDYNFNFKNVNSYVSKNKELSPDVYLNCYKEQIKKSINSYATSMTLNPDMVYANSSLKNIMLINKGKNFCYSYIHPRVSMEQSKAALENFRDKNGLININSKQLVRLAMENLHDSDKFANDELDTNITTRGKSWRQIDEKTFVVIGTSINPQIFNFQPKDLKYIANLTKLSEYDRALPNYLLSDSRLRFITSSDLYFAIELTHDEDNQADPIKNQYNDQRITPGTHGEFAGSSVLLTWTMD